MKPVAIILKDWFDSFNTDVTITTVTTVSTDVYKLTFNCGLSLPYAFITMSLTVTHAGTPHVMTVTAIGDCDFTVTGDYTPVVGDTFTQVAPTFIHGTQKKAKPELDAMIKNGNLTYPLIYLQEIQVEKILNDPLSATYSKPSCRIWFMLPSVPNWITDVHYDKDINPMANLAKEFVNQLYYDAIVTERSEFDLVYHANIGTDGENANHLKDLLNQHYSGVLLITTLSISKQSCCCC